MYFDAERWSEAVPWYLDALSIKPNDANVRTDLGVCYYYLNEADKALEQFELALKIDPKNAKTLLNAGIVKAFGKQDMEGAKAYWQRVVQLAPTSPEGEAAARALNTMPSGSSQ